MTLADEARAAARPHGPKCGVGQLQVTDPALYAEILNAFRDDGLATSWIAAALKGRGVSLSQDTLQRHRRGDCRC